MCDMQAVAVSSTTEAPALAFDCARHDDADDEDHDRKNWAKEVMLHPEQEGAVTLEVRPGHVNTEASVMPGEDNIMVLRLLNLFRWPYCSFESNFFFFLKLDLQSTVVCVCS